MKTNRSPRENVDNANQAPKAKGAASKSTKPRIRASSTAAPAEETLPSPLSPSKELRELLKQQEASVNEEEVQLKEAKERPPVAVQIGELLSKQNLRSIELVRSWDKSGSGTISRKDFRLNVMEIGSISADPAEVDAVFATMDTDGGGTLELNEVKPAFALLQDEATRHQQKVAKMSESLQRSRRRLALTHEAVADAEAASAVEDELRPSAVSVGAQLGALLTGVELSPLIKDWEKSSRSISKSEPIRHMRCVR